MTDKFFIGYVTGIIALAMILIVNAQWYVSILLATGCYFVGRFIAMKIGGDRT